MDKIATDNPLSDVQTETLATVVGLMIPASAEYGVPGADDSAILGAIVATARQHAEVIAEALDDIDARAQAAHGAALAALASDQAIAVVEAAREAAPAFVRILVSITVQCYYRDPRVMSALGMEARPPFPKGFDVPQGDWSLLEPVRQRGKVWRDAK